jgi:hypothetical protein
MPTVFPNAVWNRTSPTRENPNNRRAPDCHDYDIISEEVRVIEEWILQRNKDVWNDVKINMFNLGGVNDPVFSKAFDDGAGSNGVYLWRFGHTTVDHEVFFSCQMTHSWKIGSAIYPHVHWVPAVTASGKVKWGLEYTLTNVGGMYPDNTTIITANQHLPADTTLISKKHYTTSFAPIEMLDKKESVLIICRLFRQPTDGVNDTYGNFAGLLDFDFHYQADKLGSISEFP